MTSDAFQTDVAAWRRALRHLTWALFAVFAIAVTVNLLALPVVHAQTRPELRIGYRYEFNVKPITPEVAADQQKISYTCFALNLIPKAIKVSDAVVFAQP